MLQPFPFKASLVVAAISLMAGGQALAVPPTVGNTLIGPELKSSGAAAVRINQSGTGNITSSTGAANGSALVVDQSDRPSTILTIQQVGTGNTLGLKAFTKANTHIRVFQGSDAEAGNTGKRGTDATKTVSSNSAMVGIGRDATGRAGATDVFLTQQGDSNLAGLLLGNTAGEFTGVLNLLQVGNSNSANVTINGQTSAGQTFNIGQTGDGNSLSLTANGNQSTGMTLDFGGLSFGQTTSLPGSSDTDGANNAASYQSTVENFSTALAGINLLGTDQFNIKATGGSNDIQVDLAGAAATGNRINVNMNGTSNLAVYGLNGANIKLGQFGALNLSKNLVVYANGGLINMNRVNFSEGGGYFSTADGGTININARNVGSEGMTVLQSGAAHSFSYANNVSDIPANLNVNQTGLIASSINLTQVNGSGGGSFNLTQTSEAAGGAHGMTLFNRGGGASSWTVAQSGAGAKILSMGSDTPTAVINVTQTGGASQRAAGIDFAAASGSTFTLVQR